MLLPNVLDCFCGHSPHFYVRSSIVEDLSSKSEVEVTEYAVGCPCCRGVSPWVQECEGGIEFAAQLWNELMD